MTHLEILAGRLNRDAQDAIEASMWFGKGDSGCLRAYYVGKAVGLYLSADKLRAEAMDRGGIDKEVKE